MSEEVRNAYDDPRTSKQLPFEMRFQRHCSRCAEKEAEIAELKRFLASELAYFREKGPIFFHGEIVMSERVLAKMKELEK